LAGVSISTASRVLNNTQSTIPISPITRQKVLSAAKRLEYVPSAAARILRVGSSKTLGILGTSPQFFREVGKTEGNGFANEAMHGLLETCVKRGYHITLLTGTEDSESGLPMGVFDGLLVINRDLGGESELIEQLRTYSKPIVYASDYPADAAYCAADDVGGGELATRKLLEAGHTRIGFVRTHNFTALFDRRQSGWEQGLRSAGIAPREDWVVSLSKEITTEQWASLCSLTAIVCANFGIYLRLLEAAAQFAGKDQKLLSDMSVVVFSYRPAHHEVLLETARVTIPLSEIVAEAADMLIDLIEGKPRDTRRKLFPYEFSESSTIHPKIK
jgi:LacI family transcriptional regulator